MSQRVTCRHPRPQLKLGRTLWAGDGVLRLTVTIACDTCGAPLKLRGVIDEDACLALFLEMPKPKTWIEKDDDQSHRDRFRLHDFRRS